MATTKTVIGNVVTAVTNNIAKIKTAIGNATTSAAGLMSDTDKTKLDGVDTGATKTTIVNNLTATEAGSALDATQGKALSDSISSLNSSLANCVMNRGAQVPSGMNGLSETGLGKLALGSYAYTNSGSNFPAQFGNLTIFNASGYRIYFFIAISGGGFWYRSYQDTKWRKLTES